MSAHTLEDIRREYDRLDALCGVDTSAVALRVSARAFKRLGSCKCVGGHVESVTVSAFVLDAPDGVFYDTIRHEYAHALVKLRRPQERHGHDAVWKSACREVGCPPERCFDQSLLPAPPERRPEPYRYRLRCLSCGASWEYKRLTKAFRLIEGGSRRCVCPRCRERCFAAERL